MGLELGRSPECLPDAGAAFVRIMCSDQLPVNILKRSMTYTWQ
jgi:hypothetical protein